MVGGGGLKYPFKQKILQAPTRTGAHRKSELVWCFVLLLGFFFLPFLPPPTSCLFFQLLIVFSGTNLGLGPVPLVFGKSEQLWLTLLGVRKKGQTAHGSFKL